ncbi:MAG: hypothetical protein ACU0GG_06240 [Paracoccaceae bacterium]
MLKPRAKATVAALTAILSFGLSPKAATSQSYQIDCAILLCLSGGWPASTPCARARAEFIRRITPWPVEPPLQIWRCPMGASFENPSSSTPLPRLWDILAPDASRRNQSFPQGTVALPRAQAQPAVYRSGGSSAARLPGGFALMLAQASPGADIDISGPEFNFVRSIRVYNVTYASQRESGGELDRECNRHFSMRIGTYDTQGGFYWSRGSSPSQLPEAHVGLERYGEHCPGIFHRSVFVDWRDFEGNYGFEQVNY